MSAGDDEDSFMSALFDEGLGTDVVAPAAAAPDDEDSFDMSALFDDGIDAEVVGPDPAVVPDASTTEFDFLQALEADDGVLVHQPVIPVIRMPNTNTDNSRKRNRSSHSFLGPSKRTKFDHEKLCGRMRFAKLKKSTSRI